MSKNNCDSAWWRLCPSARAPAGMSVRPFRHSDLLTRSHDSATVEASARSTRRVASMAKDPEADAPMGKIRRELSIQDQGTRLHKRKVVIIFLGLATA